MEDDVQLKPNFQVLLREYLEASPPRWDILSLFLHPDRRVVKVMKNEQQSLNHEMAIQTDFPFTGMQAYVLTRESAKRIFECVKHQFDTIDNMIGCCAGGGGFCPSRMPQEVKSAERLQAYVLQPSLVTHGRLKTAIHPPNKHDKKAKAIDFLSARLKQSRASVLHKSAQKSDSPPNGHSPADVKTGAQTGQERHSAVPAEEIHSAPDTGVQDHHGPGGLVREIKLSADAINHKYFFDQSRFASMNDDGRSFSLRDNINS